MTVKRSRHEQAEAAELFLALSTRTMPRRSGSAAVPVWFMGAGGTGFETLTDEQRQAWREASRSSVGSCMWVAS